jgi:hypothetical protein
LNPEQAPIGWKRIDVLEEGMSTKPQPPDILYHYCSVDTFQSIILSKTLWLSDLSKSNDSKEGKIAVERLSQWLKEKHTCTSMVFSSAGTLGNMGMKNRFS